VVDDVACMGSYVFLDFNDAGTVPIVNNDSRGMEASRATFSGDAMDGVSFLTGIDDFILKIVIVTMQTFAGHSKV